MATILPRPTKHNTELSTSLNGWQDDTMSFTTYWPPLDPRLAILGNEFEVEQYYQQTDHLHLQDLDSSYLEKDYTEDAVELTCFKSVGEPQLRLDFGQIPYQLPRYASQESSDSTASEYTLSPGIGRNRFMFSPASICDSPVTTAAVANVAWFHQPAFQHSAPYADPCAVESQLDSYTLSSRVDTIRSHVQTPQEVETRRASPSDSGVGESIEDEESTMQDAGDDDEDTEYHPRARNQGPSRQTRRRSTKQNVVQNAQERVQKPARRRTTTSGTASTSKKRAGKAADRGFPCTFHHFGCDKQFGSKNEWKRHVTSQHLQLWCFVCDLDGCADHERGVNVFNRKDLFTQHCRRMHAPWQKGNKHNPSKTDYEQYDIELVEVRNTCWVKRREPPERSWCGICRRVFEDDDHGAGKAWDARMEHVGRHYEKDRKGAEDEEVDQDLRDWAVEAGIVHHHEEDKYSLRQAPGSPLARITRYRRSSNESRYQSGQHEDDDAPGEEE